MDSNHEVISGKEVHIPRFPQITFEISQELEDQPDLEMLQNSVQQFESVWKNKEKNILESFERVTENHWPKSKRHDGIPVIFTASYGSYSNPLLIGVRDFSRWAKEHNRTGEIRDTNSLMGSFIHELAHKFMRGEDLEFIKNNFAERIDQEKLKDRENDTIDRVFREAYVELLWDAVVANNFSGEQIQSWLERRKVAHSGVYPLIESLSDNEKKLIINRKYRNEIESQK